MSSIPHPDIQAKAVNCVVITVSDTRSPANDSSGQLIKELLTEAGHQIVAYTIVKDEPEQIIELLKQFAERLEVEVLIFNGGTGVAPRDTTYDAISQVLEKTLPGFGELFRYLSYEEIGSRAIASRAVAGVYRQKLIFSLPGSTRGVRLALERLILPEIVHLVKLLSGQS